MSKADLSGNIVFGFIMGAVNVILVVSSRLPPDRPGSEDMLQ